MKKTGQNDNKQWFSRKNAFDFLNIDADNILRIKKILNFLKEYRKKTKRSLKLLDIGCGDGLIGQKIKNLGYEVCGVDLSEHSLELAKKKNIKTKLADITEKLPYKKANFDLIFAGEIIEHLFDTRKFLAEIKRVLKRNGILILTTPNLAHLPDRFQFLMGNSPLQVQPMHEHLYMHIRPFTFGTIQQALTTYKFKIFRKESTMVVFQRNSKNPEIVTKKSIFMANLFPSLGSFIIVYAKSN